MTAAYASHASDTSTDGDNVTIPKPSGLAVGDTVIVYLAIADNDNGPFVAPVRRDHLNRPVGNKWELIDLVDTTQEANVALYWRVMEQEDIDAVDLDTWTYTGADANAGFIGVATRITSANAVRPIGTPTDTTGTAGGDGDFIASFNNTAVTTATCENLLPLSDDTLIMRFSARPANQTQTPSGGTERWDLQANGSSTDVSAAMVTETQATRADSGDITFDLDSGTAAWISHTLVIRPEAPQFLGVETADATSSDEEIEGNINIFDGGVTAETNGQHDIAIALVTGAEDDEGSAITAMAGWEQIATLVTVDASGSELLSAVFWKRLGFAEQGIQNGRDANLQLFNMPGTGVNWSLVSRQVAIQIVQGADRWDPIDDSASGTTTGQCEQVTSTVDDVLLMWFTAEPDDASSNTPPGGTTERFDAGSAGSVGDSQIAGADEVQASSGASGTRLWNSGSFGTHQYSLAIAPAGRTTDPIAPEPVDIAYESDFQVA